ncbi:MAG: hypothetical protein K0Q87_2707 [Neobacillus sp.]|jgi:hypothetical protein|nr:hypothetical protein [Neobacillus sp.]
MSLTDFFRINLPYGIKKNSSGEWFAFNREYVPLGWNTTRNSESIYEQNPYDEQPIYTKFKGLTEHSILNIVKDLEAIKKNENGEINCVFFYNDRTNPQSNPQFWNDYFEIIKAFSKFEIA